MKVFVLFCICVVVTLSALAQSSDSSGVFFAKGTEEQKNKRFAVAFQYFQKAAQLDSSNPETWKQLGYTATELRRYPDAKKAFQKVYALKKDDTAAMHQLAVLNFNGRRWDEAISFAQLMRKNAMYDGTNFILGKSYYELENYAEAFKYLEAAVSDDPANAQIPYLIAVAYVDMNNYKKAVPYFQKALSLDSTNAKWTYELAMTYSAIPDDKTAVGYYELAAARGYKTDNDYYENLSTSCILSGQSDRGIQLMLNVLEKKPADINLLYNIAETYYRVKKYPEAIEYWDKVLEQDKQHARSLYMIGMSYQKKGDKTKGQKLCDKAIEMDPSLSNLKQKRMETGL